MCVVGDKAASQLTRLESRRRRWRCERGASAEESNTKKNKSALQGGNLLEVNAADLLAVAGDFADARATAWNEAHVLRGKGHIFLVG